MEFRDSILNRYDEVDTLLSNVGIGFFGPFEKALKCFEINVIGTAALLHAFIPYMRKRRAGKIL